MNVRKQRTHQCGLTNIDYRTKGDFASVDRYNPSLMYADVGTMGKSLFKPRMASEAPAKDKWKTQGGWLLTKKPDPKEDQARTMYDEKGKSIRDPVRLAASHAELEREQWNDKVFTGDNVKVTAKLSQAAADRDNAIQRGGRNLIAEMEEKTKNLIAKK